MEAAAQLLEADDRDGGVADRDRAAAGEDQRERERRDEHRGRDERADRRQRQPPADERAQLRHAGVPQLGVPRAKRRCHAVGADLLGLVAVGHHVLEVRAVPLELGQLDAPAGSGPGCCARSPGRSGRSRAARSGTRIGATVMSTATTPTATTSVEMIVTSPNTTADDCPPAAIARPLQAVVELGALVRLEVDLGRDVEDLVHRPAVHPLAERDPQLAGECLAQRRRRISSTPSTARYGRQLTGVDAGRSRRAGRGACARPAAARRPPPT